MARPHPLPTRAATLQDVADVAQVHRSTASRALNPETSGRITPEVVARVAEAARALNYRRDLVAAGMRNSRTGLIGMLVPDIGNPVFAPILAGVEAALADAGYSVLVANARGDDIDLVEGLWSRRAEGLVLATAHDDDKVIARCVAEWRPAVLVNRADRTERLPASTSDDRQGMRLAVAHLISLGHRRIAHLAGPLDVSTGRMRREGFQMALREAGLAPGPVVAATTYSREAGEAAASLLLEAGPFTAIVAANDLLALGAYRAIAARGLRCPDDVSVTGHNDMPLVDMVQPPLTTVRIDLDRIGRAAASLLLDCIRNPDAPVRHILAEPELVVRGSTAAVAPTCPNEWVKSAG
jgi:LacI family transcriptional regulator